MPRKPELRSGKRAQKPIRTTPTAATGDTPPDPIPPIPASTLAFARRLAMQLAGRLDPKIRAAILDDVARHEREHPFTPASSEPFRPRETEIDQ